MSVEAKSVASIETLIIGQLQGSIGQTIPLLPKSFSRVLAKALAAVHVQLYKYGGFIFLQQYVAHATMQEVTINGKRVRPLAEWGNLIGAGEPVAAQRAELNFSVTVLNQTGTLKAGQKLVRSETGVIYTVLSERALDAPTVQVRIKAVSDQTGGDGSGDIGNLADGDTLSFASTPPNVASEGTVASTAVQGANAEDVEVYRRRIIRYFQRRPQGGAYADYQTWAEGVAGILNAYPYAAAMPGEVDVFVEATVASSGSPDGIPTAPQLTAVLNAINLDVGGRATRRPVNAAVNVKAITRSGISVVVVGLEVLDEPATQTAIESGLDEYLRSREPFIVGLSVLPRTDRITQAAVAGIVNDIVDAAGGSVASVALGHSFEARSLRDGEKAKLQLPVTYQ